MTQFVHSQFLCLCATFLHGNVNLVYVNKGNHGHKTQPIGKLVNLKQHAASIFFLSDKTHCTMARRLRKLCMSHSFFSVFLAFDFCRFCVVIQFFHPATTVNDFRLRMIFYPRFYPLHLFSYLNSWERAIFFPFECSVLNKGTTGTIFITSLVWRGPWLGIEPVTSLTRSQHYTTRLSRRRWIHVWGE